MGTVVLACAPCSWDTPLVLLRESLEFYKSLGASRPVLLVAAEDHRSRLLAELDAHAWVVDEVFGRFVWAKTPVSGAPLPLVWAVDVWLDPLRIRYSSFEDLCVRLGEKLAVPSADASRWIDMSTRHRPLSSQLTQKLNSFCASSSQAGVVRKWAQLRTDEAVFASRSLWPWGFLRSESRLRPGAAPSQAISKLNEAFEILGSPDKSDRVVDLGASPGSWTFACLQRGSAVFATDRSPLESSKWPPDWKRRLSFRAGDAFSWDFSSHQPTWILSDLICTPEKLYTALQGWLRKCPGAGYVCTLKFKSDEGLDWIPRFQSIPDSLVLHLQNNQNEATFLKSPEKPS
jgi:23S rRNA (cytidine2498-2'-O)-methyltransferase